ENITDTIALKANNELLKDQQGDLVFRPGGHGALLNNLNNLEADVILIKNIDNVLPPCNAETMIYHKKVLIGKLLEVKELLFDLQRKWVNEGASLSLISLIIAFYKDTLNIDIQIDNDLEIQDFIFKPIRIC